MEKKRLAKNVKADFQHHENTIAKFTLKFRTEIDEPILSLTPLKLRRVESEEKKRRGTIKASH